MTLIYPLVIYTIPNKKKSIINSSKLKYEYLSKILFNIKSSINKCNMLYISTEKITGTQHNRIRKSMSLKKKNKRKFLNIHKQNRTFVFEFLDMNKISYLSTFLIVLLFVFYKIYKNSNFLNEVVFNSWWQSNLNKGYINFYRFLFLNLNLKHYFLISNFSLQFYTRIKKKIKKYFFFKSNGKKKSKVVTNFQVNAETCYYIDNISANVIVEKQYIFDNLLQIVGKNIKLKSENSVKNNIKTNLFFNYWYYLRSFFFTKKIKKIYKQEHINILHKVFFSIFNCIVEKKTINSICLKIYEAPSSFSFKNVTLNIFWVWIVMRVKRFNKIGRKIRKKLKRSFMLKNNKRILRFTSLKDSSSICKVFGFIFFLFFLSRFEFICFKVRVVKQPKNLAKRRFFIKWFLRGERKKRRLVLRHFFRSKRLRKRKFKKSMKKFKFKQRFLKVKRLISKRNNFLTSFKNTNLFFNIFLTSFSLKFMLLYSLILSSKFRRYISSSMLFFKNVLNYRLSAYFQSYIAQYNSWSNVIPFYYLSRSVKKKIKAKKSKVTQQDYSVYIRQMMGGFFESITEKKVFLKISTKLRVRKRVKRILSYLYKKHKSYQYSIGRGFFFYEMLFVCWYSFFSKDINFLMSWLTKTMCKLEFKKHRKFIKIFKSLVIKYKRFFLVRNKLRGVRFDIRGKLGVKGNAKKRHLSFNVNTTSFSKKKHRLEYKQGLVYTDTGVLGVTLIFAF